MDEMKAPSEKSIPTAVAAVSRKGILPLLLTFITDRLTPARTPYTLADLLQAELPGYQDIRFYADMPGTDLPAYRHHFLPSVSGADGRASWLVLSSGGVGGAFGAGVLTGWSKRGDRPRFDLVTGVSAGALISPFAFIGAAADRELAHLFINASVTKLNQRRSLLTEIFGQSAIPAKPLRALIDAHIDAKLTEKIAIRHRTGARLLVVTTNLDAQRSMVWDIGAIAASGQPDRLRLIGDILEASASIPAIFPPIRIGVSANGMDFEELHADGGAIRQVYMLPDAFYVDPDLEGVCPDIYVIVNAELAPSFQVIPQQSVSIVERAMSSLEKASASRGIARLAAFARQNRATFRLAYIDRTLPIDRRLPFDPDYMQRSFALGQSQGRAGAWEFGPPIGTSLLEER